MSSKSRCRVLFLNGDTGDYLNTGLLNGLSDIPEVELTDYPKSEVIYKKHRDNLQPHLRGGGFTLFFQREEPDVVRFNAIFDRLRSGYFDLVIIGDIHNSFGTFVQILPFLNLERTAILDGADSPALYPYSGFYLSRPYYWLLPRAHTRCRYYKREWTDETLKYRWFHLLPAAICRALPAPRNLRKISFSIPSDKIVHNFEEKRKVFPAHIVDGEVAHHVPDSTVNYVFVTEEEYYTDLKISKFGITTKRSGWDCLRHYEIAANGAVICFRDLDQKPITCAPHGLKDGINCISYRNYDDLMRRISLLSETDYLKLQKNGYRWVGENTCKRQALRLLREFQLTVHEQ